MLVPNLDVLDTNRRGLLVALEFVAETWLTQTANLGPEFVGRGQMVAFARNTPSAPQDPDKSCAVNQAQGELRRQLSAFDRHVTHQEGFKLCEPQQSPWSRPLAFSESWRLYRMFFSTDWRGFHNIVETEGRWPAPLGQTLIALIPKEGAKLWLSSDP